MEKHANTRVIVAVENEHQAEGTQHWVERMLNRDAAGFPVEYPVEYWMLNQERPLERRLRGNERLVLSLENPRHVEQSNPIAGGILWISKKHPCSLVGNLLDLESELGDFSGAYFDSRGRGIFFQDVEGRDFYPLQEATLDEPIQEQLLAAVCIARAAGVSAGSVMKALGSPSPVRLKAA